MNRLNRHQRMGLLFCCLLPLFSVASCGAKNPATYPVKGVVLFDDGTPVTSGTVEFLSKSQSINARGEIQPDGKFTLTTFRPNDGAVAGEHDIVILQSFLSDSLGEVSHQQHGKGQKARIVDPTLASYDTTTLSETVHEKENHFELRVPAHTLEQ